MNSRLKPFSRIISVVCAATNFDKKNPEAAAWICGGFSGAIAKALSYVIQDTTPLVDLQHENRMQVAVNAPVLDDASGVEGVVVGNNKIKTGTDPDERNPIRS